MGIICKKDIISKSQDEFHAIDKVITGYAYDIHNDIGRFCDEKIYQGIMLEKCHHGSIIADREVEVVVEYKDFIKSYKLDLLVENGVIYEFKTAKSLNHFHEQQLINYLLLTGVNHGKLLNFGPKSVEYRFVSTTLTNDDRYDFSLDASKSNIITDECEIVAKILSELLGAWGTFLDYRLFNEALVHFLGGVEHVIRPVKIYFNNKVIGEQKIQLLNSETAFHVSAVTGSLHNYEKNIMRLINHTDIKFVQWINFSQRNIIMKTIE